MAGHCSSTVVRPHEAPDGRGGALCGQIFEKRRVAAPPKYGPDVVPGNATLGSYYLCKSSPATRPVPSTLPGPVAHEARRCGSRSGRHGSVVCGQSCRPVTANRNKLHGTKKEAGEGDDALRGRGAAELTTGARRPPCRAAGRRPRQQGARAEATAAFTKPTSGPSGRRDRRGAGAWEELRLLPRTP